MLYGETTEGEWTRGVVTLEDYEEVTDYIRRSKKDFPIPSYLEIAESNLKKCLDNEDRNVTDIESYSYFYPYYKNALEGGVPKYLPPELIEKVGFFKNKYGSALVDDYELDFKAMEKDNVTEEDVWKKLEEIKERH
ncbi:hypothetical protein ES705_28258 [subsurface metagenome]